MCAIRRWVFLVVAAGLLISPRAVVAAKQSPAIENSIDKAIAFLEKEIPARATSGEAILGALALIKAGEPPETPAVQTVLKEIVKRCSGTEYQPHQHHYYTAGLEIMLFESIDPERYRPEMEKILAYILKGQLSSGAWYYPNQGGNGDTSITQYAVLGMWSAERAGLNVPASVWDEMAIWHLKTQLGNGAFSYHPGEPAESGPAPALTIGGAANLLLARRFLFGEKSHSNEDDEKDAAAQKKLFGVLESVDLDEASKRKGGDADEGKVSSTAGSISQSVSRARHRAAVVFRLPPPIQFKMYYLYALERMAALGNFKMLGAHDWYAEGARLLVTQQQPSGTWTIDRGDPIASAAFGLLFLTRSTAKMLGRTLDVPELGAGMLAGGRGLPNDLDSVEVTGGDVKTGGDTGSLGELLSRLASSGVAQVPGTQKAILATVRFGDRKKLLAQRDRVRKLVDHPRVEVRRTAFWVLGRAGNLRDVPALIAGLSDPNAQVAMEAHNALCVLSRRPLGFGIAPDPLADLDEDAGEEARAKALAEWSKRAREVWKDWYAEVAPYEERDGLGLFPTGVKSEE